MGLLAIGVHTLVAVLVLGLFQAAAIKKIRGK